MSYIHLLPFPPLFYSPSPLSSLRLSFSSSCILFFCCYSTSRLLCFFSRLLFHTPPCLCVLSHPSRHPSYICYLLLASFIFHCSPVSPCYDVLLSSFLCSVTRLSFFSIFCMIYSSLFCRSPYFLFSVFASFTLPIALLSHICLFLLFFSLLTRFTTFPLFLLYISLFHTLARSYPLFLLF